MYYKSDTVVVKVKYSLDWFFQERACCFFAVGTVSVDPRLDDQPHQLIIRESMRKFTSDHDQLEICKISSPRM